MEQNKRSEKPIKTVMTLYQLAEKGFTLIEIMVVVAIIAIIALFAAPEMKNFGPNIRVKAVSRDLHTNLQKMKTEAIKRNRNVLITLTPVNCTTTLGGTYTINVDEDNDGSVSAGDIPFAMVDDSGNTDGDYDMAQNTALCENSPSVPDTGLSSGANVFRFSSRGLWLNSAGSPLGGNTVFRIQNDRGRKYEVSVSISGGINTAKL